MPDQNPPPAPGPGGNPKKRGKRGGKRNKKKVVGKTVGVFKCTSEDCGKTWNSVHAWTSTRFVCEMCEGQAKMVKFLDEECELDTYHCDGCDNTWQAIHDDGISEQSCNWCSNVIAKEPGGTQKRVGRHYWYICRNPECKTEWEDFYQGKLYKQRCTSCHSVGELFASTTVDNSVYQRRRRNIPGLETGGSHNIDGCDMCQTFLAQGVARSCLKFKAVVFEIADDAAGGDAMEKIVGRTLK